jgi:thymidylate kinase
MDGGFGKDRYESFVKYQQRLIKALDKMAEQYGFKIIDASKSPDQIFRQLQRSIDRLLGPKPLDEPLADELSA